MSGDAHAPEPLRVVVQQPALTHYRVPVFAALASRPGIDLRVEYARWPGVPNVEPEGFDAKFVPHRMTRVLGQELVWHSSQWRNASRVRADVLVVSWNSRYLSLLPTLLRARCVGVPVVAWGHGYSKSESRLRFAARLLHARLATCLLFYSRSVAGRYLERGFPPDRIFVAPNAVDQAPIRAAADAVRADPDQQRRFLAERGLDQGPVILFVSRLEHANRVDLLLRAAARLAPTRPGLRVVIVGGGPEEHRLREQARELGVADRVLFTGPVYEEHALARYFLAATVFAYPSNIGLSLLHAFGYGVPVITSENHERHGPEIEALRPGENGLFYREGDPDALADAIERIIDNPDLRQRLSRGALRTVHEEYSLDAMVDGFVAAVFRAAGREPPAAQARTSLSPISAA
jgi:glycosyltransferase involved in cell wall biosynthesis